MSFRILLVLFLLSFLNEIQSEIPKLYSTNEPLNWAEVTATRIVTCAYNNLTGLWKDELAWQSGNTLESLANFQTLLDSPMKYIFDHTFQRTSIFTGGDCYDDHQWWLLAWIRAYNVDSNIKYLRRAALIFDIIAQKAWNASICGGGIQWCPKKPYKNAITNELFLACSMYLHPYATILGKSSTYYLNWAVKEWQWFENSGLINQNDLINDGLMSYVSFDYSLTNSSQNETSEYQMCFNNNQTTWTYNQGVILSGLALLYNVTKNSTLIDIAQKIVDATMNKLTYPNGILKEPCEPKCDDDQKLFKGIFVRHLSNLLPFLTDPLKIIKYKSFIEKNAISLLNTNRCELDGLFDLFWTNQSSNGCELPRDTSTTSSALDLLISLSKVSHNKTFLSTNWTLFGLGNCIDDNNESMPNFYKSQINETICRRTAEEDSGAVAYDYQLKCDGIGFCRIRTLSDRHQVPSGWNYEDGNARHVNNTNKESLTNCYVKL